MPVPLRVDLDAPRLCPFARESKTRAKPAAAGAGAICDGLPAPATRFGGVTLQLGCDWVAS